MEDSEAEIGQSQKTSCVMHSSRIASSLGHNHSLSIELNVMYTVQAFVKLY